MARILTRQWFWILATTVVPLLWQVLAAAPASDATPAADAAAQARVAHDLCHRLDPHACR